MKNNKNKVDLFKQYNNFSDSFSESVDNDNNVSRITFYKSLNFDFKNKKLLDLACGDGQDIPEYTRRGADCVGVDSAENFIEVAKENYPETEFQVGDMTSIPFKDETFDIVLSKYAIGTAENPNLVFDEVFRVLKKDGVFAYLTTHPMRLFMEQKEKNKNYFEQKNVDLVVFGGKFTIVEPTHTFNSFMSENFTSKFQINYFTEEYDPQSADFPGRDVYPDFFVVVATKR